MDKNNVHLAAPWQVQEPEVRAWQKRQTSSRSTGRNEGQIMNKAMLETLNASNRKVDNANLALGDVAVAAFQK